MCAGSGTGSTGSDGSTRGTTGSDESIRGSIQEATGCDESIQGTTGCDESIQRTTGCDKTILSSAVEENAGQDKLTLDTPHDKTDGSGSPNQKQTVRKEEPVLLNGLPEDIVPPQERNNSANRSRNKLQLTVCT